MALRDGAQLAGRLAQVADGPSRLGDVLQAYESEMLSHGFHVVRKSAEMGTRLMGQTSLPA